MYGAVVLFGTWNCLWNLGTFRNWSSASLIEICINLVAVITATLVSVNICNFSELALISGTQKLKSHEIFCS